VTILPIWTKSIYVINRIKVQSTPIPYISGEMSKPGNLLLEFLRGDMGADEDEGKRSRAEYSYGKARGKHASGKESDAIRVALIARRGIIAAALITALIGLLREGHTDRHEGNRPALPITQEAAEMAVHAAAMLVQWFSSGAIRRKATSDRRS
jgi:hypothetical protein